MNMKPANTKNFMDQAWMLVAVVVVVVSFGRVAW